MTLIAEPCQIIKPVSVTDGAGVKIKRSIGLNPEYFDPFLMLDEFGSEDKDDYIAGFPPHPHRGIETVTYMLAGDFEHKDSLGSTGRMCAGDVQWMKTGSGIIHSEMPLMKEGKLHGFQLWINMPSSLKMSKPEYLYLDAKEINHYSDSEKSVKVIAGKFEGINGAISNHNVGPVYFDVSLTKSNKFGFPLCSEKNSFVYLYDGEIKVGHKDNVRVKESTLITLSEGEVLHIEAFEDAKFLVISGRPINEKIVRGGPFVMNTREEILEAIQDYQNGRFIK
ncbi:pirin family protein [Betaproteobacteria bacterium]|nr:pirin family protein [Betaproteobacteria bacterium]